VGDGYLGCFCILSHLLATCMDVVGIFKVI
ncbi:MAG: hypothetical protein RI903_361, partial [Bacteroidota bacterium]